MTFEKRAQKFHTTRIWEVLLIAYVTREILLKGQMNQKTDIFSFVALPSPNTKKNHPKWDLGKDFSSPAFIER